MSANPSNVTALKHVHAWPFTHGVKLVAQGDARIIPGRQLFERMKKIDFWRFWSRMPESRRAELDADTRAYCELRMSEIASQVNATTLHLAGGPEPAGALLLNEVREFIGRFVRFSDDYALDAVTLWAAHTHIAEHFHTTPRLAILSPEPESGKTRTLEILNLVVPNSMLILSPSVAAIFRTIAKQQTTLLIDEVDTIFQRRGKDDANEDLRALLNAGYRRGATIPRCVGPRHDVEQFPVFAAVAMAAIGDLPDTIMSRSLIIKMRRRSADESIEPFRSRVNDHEGHDIRDRLTEWMAVMGESIGDAWPNLPKGVTDRRAEIWEPLLSVADAVGGLWPERARVAAVTDVTHVTQMRAESVSLGIRLLSDLRTIFDDAGTTNMHTDEILKKLNAIDESPWGGLKGGPLDARGLARRLRRYGVTPGNVRVTSAVAKGYKREDLLDPWQRYLEADLSLSTRTSVTRVTSVTDCVRCGGEGCGWCT